MSKNITENDYARLVKMCSDDEHRLNLSHPYYDAERERIVATDGHRLAYAPFKLGEKSGHVRGGPTKTARKGIAGLEIHAIAIVEPPSVFPDYEQTIPKTFTTRFDVEPDHWLDRVRPLKPKKDRWPWVAVLDLKSKFVSVAPIKAPRASDRVVLLNFAYFLDAIAFCASDSDTSVVIQTSGKGKEEMLSSVRFSSLSGDRVCVVAPMRG